MEFPGLALPTTIGPRYEGKTKRNHDYHRDNIRSREPTECTREQIHLHGWNYDPLAPAK